MLFMAHAIFHCFHKRNLKPEQRQRRTVIYFAKLMAAIDRTLLAVEAIKQARQELSRLTGEENAGGDRK